MSDAVHLALLTGGFTLIAISITAGAVLISQWMRQHSVVERGAAKPGRRRVREWALVFASGMSVVGNIECNGPAQVFGQIEGELRASDLLIGEGAQVEAASLPRTSPSAAVSRALSVPSASGSGRWYCFMATFFISRCRSTRTLCLKDCRGELRTQRTCRRRTSTPKAPAGRSHAEPDNENSHSNVLTIQP